MGIHLANEKNFHRFLRAYKCMCIFVLICSWLENPRDGGAWWAAVCGVAQSQTQLK